MSFDKGYVLIDITALKMLSDHSTQTVPLVAVK